MEEDARDLADEVAARQRVASDVGREWQRRRDLRREGPTGRGGRGYFGGVFRGVVALCGGGYGQAEAWVAAPHGGFWLKRPDSGVWSRNEFGFTENLKRQPQKTTTNSKGKRHRQGFRKRLEIRETTQKKLDEKGKGRSRKIRYYL